MGPRPHRDPVADLLAIYPVCPRDAQEAATRVGVQSATLRRWISRGLIPQYGGEWTTAVIGTARVVARMRERGHSRGDIERATEEGRLAFGFLEDFFGPEQETISIREAARETGLEPALIALPRIAIHYGVALYRDGDYYGREVNIAARIAARSAGGEVLVTRPVVELAGTHLEFERIAEVTLKGFSESTEVFIARQKEEP